MKEAAAKIEFTNRIKTDVKIMFLVFIILLKFIGKNNQYNVTGFNPIYLQLSIFNIILKVKNIKNPINAIGRIRSYYYRQKVIRKKGKNDFDFI